MILHQYRRFYGLFAICMLVVGLSVWGHSLDTLPVHTDFRSDGTCKIEVSVHPSAVSEDLETAEFLTPEAFEELDEVMRDKMGRAVVVFVRESVRFDFEPGGVFAPEFGWRFEMISTATDGDAMVAIAHWQGEAPKGAVTYGIEALLTGKMPVPFLNSTDEKPARRAQLLFPGESSYRYPIPKPAIVNATDAASESDRALGNPQEVMAPQMPQVAPAESAVFSAAATFFSFLRQGFVHVVPFGVDHVLFVLGLFLLSREWKPLLLQVTTFTVAHSVTLGLAVTGHLSLPGIFVEVVIAASLSVVALENILRPKYSHWRLVVVFGFGLIHGLGFAGALSDLSLPPAALAAGLAGFNIGVECGQVLVVAIAVVATCAFKSPAVYRKWIVIPGSAAIGLFGLYLAVIRLLAV